MATLLLVIIYICFIGLGIPDSLFGPAWPVMSGEFGLSVSVAGYLTPYFCLCTIVSSLLSDRLIHRFGTGKVTAVSTLLTVIGLFGYSCSTSIWWILAFAIPLGLGAGAVDAGLNNYVALHYKASHISYLHCFYGVGVSVSPFFMSMALADSSNWQGGYRMAALVQLVIAVIAIVAVPLWGRVAKTAHPRPTVAAKPVSEDVRTLRFSAMARNPSIRWAWAIFAVACALEVLAGTWGSTFLVNVKGLSVDTAAWMTALYYVGLALGRFLSGVLSHKLTAWRIIKLSLCVWPLSVVLFLLPLPSWVACIGLFFAGLGIGPLYPNFVYLTPRNFGRDVSQSVMGSQSAAAYVGIMAVPPLFGLLVKGVGVGAFPYFLSGLYLLLAAVVLLFIRRLKREGRYGNA